MWVWEPLLITSGEGSRVPHLLPGPGTCCGKLPRVGGDQWPGDTRGTRGWVHNLDLVTHRMMFTTVTNKGPVWGGCLVSHIVNINITHKSEGRDRNKENITGVWTVWTLPPEPAFNRLFLVLPRAPRHRDWTRINLCDWNRNLLRFTDENVYWDVTFLKRIRVDTQTLGKRGVVDSLILKVIDSPGPQSKHLSELFKPGRKLVSCSLSHSAQKHQIIPSLSFGWTRVYDRRSV